MNQISTIPVGDETMGQFVDRFITETCHEFETMWRLGIEHIIDADEYDTKELEDAVRAFVKEHARMIGYAKDGMMLPGAPDAVMGKLDAVAQAFIQLINHSSIKDSNNAN